MKVGDLVRYSRPIKRSILARRNSAAIGIVVDATVLRGGMVWVHWNCQDKTGRHTPGQLEVVA